MPRDFQIIGAMRAVEVIAAGKSVRKRRILSRKYGRGQWPKMKGIAEVQYPDGKVWIAEIHWFEAHGVGKRDFKVKRDLREL
ncbi:MAG: hypothetical protein ACRD3E_04125 [Terriglobales bacterium]